MLLQNGYFFCRKAAAMFVLLIAASACANLERDVEVKLPPYESQLVVEAYLERGKPLRLALTESSAYFSTPSIPFVNNARVSISYAGITRNLMPGVFVDSRLGKAYNYSSPARVPQNYEGEFVLEASDGTRTLSAKTKLMSPPVIKGLSAVFNRDSSASLLLRFEDNDLNARNFYWFTVNKDSLGGALRTNFSFEARFNTEGQISISTNFSYKKGDTLVLTLYHIDQSHYEFLETVEDALRANGNPFAQPTAVRSSVKGGTGIFVTLSYERRRFVVKEDALLYLPLVP